MADKTVSLGRWGSFTLSGLVGAVVTAALLQFGDCSKDEAPAPDAGTVEVLDAGLEQDASVDVDASPQSETADDAG